MKQALAGFEKTYLPIMPATAEVLRSQLDSANANNHMLQGTLLRDPAATIALYRRLEQRRPGAAEGISDPAHALSMIGREAFTQLMHELLQVGEAQQVDGQLSPAYAYSQAAHAAHYALALGRSIGNPNNETAVAALLQNPAVLALWHKDPQAAARASNAVRDGVPFDSALSAELGEALGQANKRLGEAWHFPHLAREAMGDWNPFNRQAQIVSIADMLAQVSSAGWPQEALELQTEILEEFLALDHDASRAWWHQQVADAARWLHGQGYPLPAFDFVRLPGDEEEIELPDLPSLSDNPKSPPAPTAQPAQPGNLQTVLAGLMRRAQEETGIQRAVFGMLNREHTEIRARLALGGAKSDAIRCFCISNRERNLFSLLLSKQQSIWVNRDNRAKYAPLIKNIPQDQGSARGFYAMSIFVQDKPIGLLYADGGDLNEQGYKRFRRLCREVAILLQGRRDAA